MKRSRIAAALLGTSVLIATPAFAVNSDTFGVSLTIEHECTITAGDLTFPTTGMIDHDVDMTASINVLCTDESPYAIGLSAGGNAGGDTDERKLLGPGGRTVEYQLYTANDFGTIWGNDMGVDTVDDASADESNDFTIYGRVHTGQNVPAGVYTDTVTATVWYGDETDPD